jgi:hypothetical protein
VLVKVPLRQPRRETGPCQRRAVRTAGSRGSWLAIAAVRTIVGTYWHLATNPEVDRFQCRQPGQIYPAPVCKNAPRSRRMRRWMLEALIVAVLLGAGLLWIRARSDCPDQYKQGLFNQPPKDMTCGP